jgi:hypothetical protein
MRCAVPGAALYPRDPRHIRVIRGPAQRCRTSPLATCHQLATILPAGQPCLLELLIVAATSCFHQLADRLCIGVRLVPAQTSLSWIDRENTFPLRQLY